MNLKKLIQWSKTEIPDLPWRKNRTLYKTLVSEIMLQQTTVGTVKNHFERFLLRFPDLKSLALASEEELLVAWKGLGYYRRARSLKKIAEAIVHQHQGKFPHQTEELMKISGIGPYTSHALVAIGLDQPGLAVDANLERVIARLYGIKEEKGLKLQKNIMQLFQDKKIFHLKGLSYRELNEALMDLGRTFCQARKASCELCPLKDNCIAFTDGNPLKYPVQKNETKKAVVEHELKLLRLIVMKKNKILVYKKSEKEWLAGQYEVPTLVLSTTDVSIKQYPKSKKAIKENLKTYKTGITKYSIINFIMECSADDLKRFGFELKTEWREIDEEANLSTASYKAIKLLV